MDAMENSKKYLIAVMMLSVVAVALSSAAFALSVGTAKSVGRLDNITEPPVEYATSTYSPETQVSAEKELFLLKEYCGMIGIFDADGGLYDVLDVKIISLPESDRIMLEAGIYAMSRRELASLIEDFTG